MNICSKCGGNRFKIDAVVTAKDYIELDENDPEEFEVIDQELGDSEWDDESAVECTNCGHSFQYQYWDSEPEFSAPAVPEGF